MQKWTINAVQEWEVWGDFGVIEYIFIDIWILQEMLLSWYSMIKFL